ncbi:ABC transporter permease [Labrys wisconsinensis]|uniref:Simple sugar transport system permease protein n=1 Tax=Labrys wisconsinensis TaxID=425677 RepID=A0ABU0JNG5_9HYPH|nr:ABC transporter permease [Labrys wisconsinensis]MDQ0474943.1 simple sugar transport system permease protein [Labrys wisconsinensis]
MADLFEERAGQAGLTGLMARLRGGVPGGFPGLTALLIGLIALFSLSIPGFASGRTAQAFMFQVPLLGLLSLAMVVPLITGGLNLAIIATTNQCALLMAFIMNALIGPETGGGAAVLAILAALGAGLALAAVIGLVTGALVAYTGVHPILVTLGTKSLIDGISIYLTRGTPISGIPGLYSAAGNATLLGMPMTFLVLVVMTLLVGLILRRTPFGVACAMIGSNIEATRFSAIDTKRVLVGVYLMSSLLCFVAATVMLAIFNSASAEYAQSYLLVTILAAVLGGVDPFGGFGKVTGLMLALTILQVISSGFNQYGLSNYLTLAFWGLTLIGVMAVQTIRPYLTWPRRPG